MADPHALATTPMPMPLVYAFGSNGSGQLGIGHTHDVSRPERCLFSTGTGERRGHTTNRDGRHSRLHGRSPSPTVRIPEVKKIVAGGNHTLLLTTEGRLFTAGKTRMRMASSYDLVPGQTTDSTTSSSVVFEEVTHHVLSSSALGTVSETDGGVAADRAAVIVTDVAATWEASFAVVDAKVIVGWGLGTKGELGLGPRVISTDGQVEKIFEVESAAPGDGEAVEIIGIVGSMAHVVVVLSDGRVYGWGSCRKGQLGEQLKTEKILWSPRNIGVGGGDDECLALLPWVPEKVVAGREYTIFVKAGRPPVVWGDTRFFDEEDLQVIVGEDDVVTSGWSSIHVLSPRRSDQSLQSAGRNDHGQLPPASLPPLRTVAAGSEHCVALGRDNQVIAWGWGEHGNCGETLDERGNVAGRYNLIPLSALDDKIVPKDVAAGCATSFMICGKEDG
ncbi:hypothetical protein AYL99_04927 [Fonsecaea erecta]|uniref:Uncharacterized protein n=1 Tax=Fonsecaea erecta TaxID=1367422 RepID=A0A178ZLM3_9EURO|nr:hypothetical protein AYL99_04927 [Fonsecaea erecta]OAP59925.1 hypothetical protein AYL99_04927 [Fonsecaea erecta]